MTETNWLFQLLDDYYYLMTFYSFSIKLPFKTWRHIQLIPIYYFFFSPRQLKFFDVLNLKKKIFVLNSFRAKKNPVKSFSSYFFIVLYL